MFGLAPYSSHKYIILIPKEATSTPRPAHAYASVRDPDAPPRDCPAAEAQGFVLCAVFNPVTKRWQQSFGG